jgi:hypothetical protein
LQNTGSKSEFRPRRILRYATVCLGQFTHSAAELTGVLACAMQGHVNSLSVAKLNRQYLRFARLAAKDVAAGKFEMLVRLGVTWNRVKCWAI